jgi:hypothetical protein
MKKALVLAMALVAGVSFGATMTLLVDGAAWDGSDVDIASSLSVVGEATALNGGPTADYAVTLSNATGASVAVSGDGFVTWLLAPLAPTAVETPPSVVVSGLQGSAFGATGKIYQIDFKAASEGVLDITQAGDISGGKGPDITGVNIVPEPMTMALLGLGGLVLRRRK